MGCVNGSIEIGQDGLSENIGVYSGSARLMERTGGLMGGKELAVQGTPIECIEGDGDNTLIACSKDELNISLKK